jgi:seryl-tRNA synthetase
MSAADRKLKTKIAGWESACPEDLSEITDIRKATTATTRLERELKTVQQQFKQRKSDDYKEFTADQIDEQFDKVKAYQKELKDLTADLTELRKWLTKVRASSYPLPFAMVAKGNRKGSLHVFKQENRVRRRRDPESRSSPAAKSLRAPANTPAASWSSSLRAVPVLPGRHSCNERSTRPM